MPEPGKTPPRSVIPAKFQNPETSGLTLDVENGKPVEATFDVKSK